jgi:hypothetical protein
MKNTYQNMIYREKYTMINPEKYTMIYPKTYKINFDNIKTLEDLKEVLKVIDFQFTFYSNENSKIKDLYDKQLLIEEENENLF